MTNLLQENTQKPAAQIAHLVFANPRNTDPKKLKEQFLSNTLDKVSKYLYFCH